MTLILSGTDGVSDIDGTAATPAIRGTDANTGIFFPAADTIAFAEGGAEAMRIDSSGNVGIGTSSFASGGKLVVKTSNAGYVAVEPTSSVENQIATGLRLHGNANETDRYVGIFCFNGAANNVNSMTFWTTNGSVPAERMRIDSSGNVVVGNTTALGKLDVGLSTDIRRFLVTYDDSIVTIKSSNQSSNPETFRLVGDNIRFSTGTTGSGTERARITSGGAFLVGKTTINDDVEGLHINSSGIIEITTGNSGTTYPIAFYRSGSGTAVGYISTTAGATQYVTSSDYRLKENIAPMTGALNTVARLNPVTYTWKTDGSTGQGFIAHELQAVVPDCVVGEKDAVDEDGNPKYQGVDTSFLVATLTAAIQELNAKVDAQATRIEALEAQNAAFEARLAALEAK